MKLGRTVEAPLDLSHRNGDHETRIQHKKSRWAWVSTILVVAGVAGAWWYETNRWVLTTGRVVIDRASVSAIQRGRIVGIDVKEGDRVELGQVLVRLEDEEAAATTRRAEAVLEQAKERSRASVEAGLDPLAGSRVREAELERDLALEAQKGARARRESAATALRDAEGASARVERLYLIKSVTRNEWDAARATERTTRAALGTAEAELAEATKAVEGRESLLDLAEAGFEYARRNHEAEVLCRGEEVRRAQAEVEACRQRQSEMAVRAPAAGVVAWLPRRLGEVVDDDDALLSLAGDGPAWVEAYVNGEDLGRLKDGAEAWVEVDGAEGSPFPARIAFIQPTAWTPGQVLRVGPERAITASELPLQPHAVKVLFNGAPPGGLRPESVVRVKISRE